MRGATWKKLALVALLVAAVAAFLALDLQRYLTLEQLKASRENLRGLYAEHTLAVLGVYFLGYIVVVGLNLPGALIMTLAGGALFGFWVGLVTVSFASSIGASLAFLVARYLLRDWVQRRFGARLAGINRGVEREGAFYLFSMRLVPLIPFFLINLLMGLTPMRLWTFYWVSQVGMLAGTAVYVNAGAQIGQLESLSGILSPGLIISFVLLGLFPLAARKLLQRYRARHGKPGLDPQPPA